MRELKGRGGERVVGAHFGGAGAGVLGCTVWKRALKARFPPLFVCRARPALLCGDAPALTLPAGTTRRSQYDLKGLKALGGFRNVRQEFDWQGLVLELDQTKFAHGTVYELEAETVCKGEFRLGRGERRRDEERPENGRAVGRQACHWGSAGVSGCRAGY